MANRSRRYADTVAQFGVKKSYYVPDVYHLYQRAAVRTMTITELQARLPLGEEGHHENVRQATALDTKRRSQPGEAFKAS